MKMQLELLAAITLGLILGIPGRAQAQYTYTTIDVPGSTRTSVNRNSSHALAGEFDDEDGTTHGFVLNNGVFTTIDVPGSVYTTIYGINNSGELCGYFSLPGEGDVTHGFFRDKKGVFTTLDPPGSVHTFANGINEHGDIVGVYRDSDQTRHGFLLSKGIYTTLDVPGAGGPDGGTIPLGMNDHGEVVGDFTYFDGWGLYRFPFVESDGVFTPLYIHGSDIPGFWWGVATGINNAGTVVGSYLSLLDFGFHGYVLQHGQYATVDVDGPFSQTNVTTINAEGQIGGRFTDEDGATHGFVGTPVNN
jgi:uncharacterized membrane protein